MICNPKKGQRVQAWYRAVVGHVMPLHGRIGEVVIVGTGRPRNHGVEIDGTMYSIPCGNLRKVNACDKVNP